MKPACKSLLYLTFPLVTLGTLVTVGSVRAQSQSITTDGTLSTQVESNDNLNFDINQGNRQGNNLFHSFGNFSVPNNGSARFQNPTDIVNIFGRVTGGNISNINGLIQAQGAANLFLINPKGIVFGPNASLDIGGSFFASTASSILFDGGVEFSATDTQPSPLLSVNMPIGLRFRDNPGSITIGNNQGTNPTSQSLSLSVQPGKTLGFVGGDVNLEEANLNTFSFGGRTELGSISGEDFVSLTPIEKGFALGYDGVQNFGSITLKNSSILSQAFSLFSGVEGNGGAISITGRSLSLIDSSISASTSSVDNGGEISITVGESLSLTGSSISTDTSAKGNAGEISITVGDSINLNNSSIDSNLFLSQGEGGGGNINLKGRSLSLINSSRIATGTSGILVIVDDSITLNNDSSIFSGVTGVSGPSSEIEQIRENAGNINIKGRSLSLTNFSRISASTSFGKENAGDILVNVDDSITLNDSFIDSSVSLQGEENGGNINIKGRSLSLTNGSRINSSTSGKGNGGEISVTLGESLSLTDSSISASTFSQGNAGEISITVGDSINLNDDSSIVNGVLLSRGEGNGGNINLKGRSLSLTNLSKIDNSTSGKGNAGDILVSVDDSINLNSLSSIASRVSSQGEGNGGNINIKGRSLSLTDSSQIDSSSSSQGDAGDILVSVDDSITLNSSSILSDVGSSFSKVEGNGGNINLKGRSLSSDRSRIDTSTSGKGNAGDILITVDDSINLNNFSFIASEVGFEGEGNGGNINLKGRSLSLTDSSQIDTSTSGKGSAGEIQVNTSDFVILSGVGSATFLVALPENVIVAAAGGSSSGLFTNTEKGSEGEGGPISITTSKLQILDGAVVSARSQNSFKGGEITVNADNLELTGGGQIITTALSEGDAGNININVIDTIKISGSDPTFFNRFNQVAQLFGEERAASTTDAISSESGIFATTTKNSTGNGGNIFIDPKTVEILDSGKISAESLGQGTGGNIDIRVNELLLLRRGGTISTSSNTDGGNININTGVLVALPKENSDISANAVQGMGGRVDITAQGIFGIVPRDFSTDLSDITASSEFGVSGTVTINNPEVDPNNGLVELPETVVDAKNLIAQNACRQGIDSELVTTGRGGLPTSPAQDLSSGTVRVGLATSVVSKTTASNPTASQPKSTPMAKRFVPAQGWVFNSKGQIVLTAYVPNSTGVRRTSRKGLCAKR